MSERVEQLLPWWPIDALSEEERLEVRALLEESGEAADLLEFAHLLREAVQAEAQQERLSSRLLVDWVDEPERLHDEVRHRIEQALARDPRAAEAVEVLRQLAAVPAVMPEAEAAPLTSGAEQRAGVGGAAVLLRVWQELRGLLLYPVPAFAQLLVLAVAGLLVWLALQQGGTPSARSGGVVQLARVEQPDSLRSGGGSERESIVVPFADDAPLVLELETRLDLAELESPSLALVVRGPRSFELERRLRKEDFEAGSVLRFLMPGDPAPPAGRYEIEIRYESPGSPLDGQLGYSTVLELRPPATGDRATEP